MSLLDNDEIATRVDFLVKTYTKSFKMRPQDEPVLQAGVDLLVNLLQNINDLAYDANQREARARGR
jgi:hypothetical protein